MEVPLQRSKSKKQSGRYKSVSILVLMEVPLQPTGGSGATVTFTGFNPCFNGSSSSTIPDWRPLDDE